MTDGAGMAERLVERCAELGADELRVLLLAACRVLAAFLEREEDSDDRNDAEEYGQSNERGVVTHDLSLSEPVSYAGARRQSTPQSLYQHSRSERGTSNGPRAHQPWRGHSLALNEFVENGKHRNQHRGFSQELANHFSGSLSLGSMVGRCQWQRHRRGDCTGTGRSTQR